MHRRLSRQCILSDNCRAVGVSPNGKRLASASTCVLTPASATFWIILESAYICNESINCFSVVGRKVCCRTCGSKKLIHCWRTRAQLGGRPAAHLLKSLDATHDVFTGNGTEIVTLDEFEISC